MIQRFTTLSSLAVLLALTSGGPSFSGVGDKDSSAAASHTPARRLVLSREQMEEQKQALAAKLLEAEGKAKGAAEEHEETMNPYS